MPELDGYELAAMIRQHPRFQRTSIIFVSAVLADRSRSTARIRVRRGGLRAGSRGSGDPARQGQRLRRAVSQDARARAAQRRARAASGRADRRARGDDRGAAGGRSRKDEFLAMLAHELRNPLAPIRTAVQLLRTRELAEAQSMRARDVIERQVEHLVCLIDDLLDVSRITRGHDYAAARAGADRRRRRPGRRDGPPAHRRAPARAHARPARGAAQRGRRLDSPRADHRQHPAQRRQVHGAGRPHHVGGGAGRLVRRDQGEGHGDGDSERARPEDLRPLLAGAPEVRKRARRPRHRPRARAASRRDARRSRRRQQSGSGPRDRDRGSPSPAGRDGDAIRHADRPSRSVRPS